MTRATKPERKCHACGDIFSSAEVLYAHQVKQHGRINGPRGPSIRIGRNAGGYNPARAN